MNIEIQKLSIDLLDDWLYYFDHVAFSDNNGWSGCYCMHYHWSDELENKWRTTGKADNRDCAVKLIQEGILQGYLAYYDGNAIGWCNANDKDRYDTVLFKFHWEDSEKDKKIKSIVCFNVAPDMRNKGIASMLLKKVCEDALHEKYEYVEAYPFNNGDNKNYHGSISMYEKNGFKVYGNIDNYSLVRRYLQLH